MSTNLDDTVTKTFSGLIVLPADHYLVTRKNRSIEQMNRIGKSACDQCTACTEFCPRYLLGYEIQPHKVMRSLGFTTSGEGYWNRFSSYCCSCGICTLYACPEDLYPREACEQSKLTMKQAGENYRQDHKPQVHPMKDFRRIPTKGLLRRLRIERFEVPAPFASGFPKPGKLVISLQQNAGRPSQPIVQEGGSVTAGDLIADLPGDSLGATIHAPLSGRIEALNNHGILIVSN
jgi:Na+-translocating ferredoxin:NAD+ oxidoreductase RnfC subunit